MKKNLTFILFILSMNICFSQNLGTDTIYFNQNKDTINKEVCCFNRFNNPEPNPLFYLKDSSLFSGVIISNKTYNSGNAGVVLMTYELKVDNYNQGKISKSCTSIYYGYETGLGSAQNSPLITPHGYVLNKKRYTNSDGTFANLKFQRNGDTLSYCYGTREFNQDEILIQEECTCLDFYKKNHLNYSSFYQLFNLTYLTNGKKKYDSHSFRYFFNRSGDTISYSERNNEYSYSYHMYNLRNDNSTKVKVEFKGQNDSLYDILNTNLIFVDKKFNLISEKEFIKNLNNNHMRSISGEIGLAQIQINKLTYFIVFSHDTKYKYMPYKNVNQNIIDKIVKRYKKVTD